jgi:hypothetical protein
MEAPFGWHEFSRDDMMRVHRHLAQLESQTWNDILVIGNRNNHAIAAGDLSSEARKCLKQAWQGGVDEVISLRLTARERIFGIMDQGTLHLLWWDPDHQVCPSTFLERRS